MNCGAKVKMHKKKNVRIPAKIQVMRNASFESVFNNAI